MSQEPSDFQRFVGPDHRKLPRPRGMALVVVFIAIGVAVGLFGLWPGEQPLLDRSFFGFTDEVISAEVESVDRGPCSYAVEFDCVSVVFAFDTEVRVGTFLQEFAEETGAPDFVAGDSVYLSVVYGEDGTESLNYHDRNRGPLLIVVAAGFGLAVVALGRLRGLAALVGLAISVFVLIRFIIPAIIDGQDAVLVAVVGGGAIALVSLYLAHGYTPLTHVAAVGAFAALALTTGLSWLVVGAAELSGLASEESFYLLSIPDFDLTGLVLAGIVLGAIGALDDVTVTQASAVWEVGKANPEMSQRALFESGLRIGRDHIASTVNTLLLAYAGAAMPLLILFSLSDLPLGVVASSEVVAVEIVRTLVGSIGLVAAVPITTWLAAAQRVRNTR
ncbi:MAG TPA: YibE/F family protein [Acidimicrobiia bacterium]|nr:YibE/F family protein [Acidimicrobiia bacterium]